ncbi:triose-phosphate isomerase [Patescibacteria group bacterium]|nr:MAG: triose-phosphate isomerase [Patescibacteria group bacterium]
MRTIIGNWKMQLTIAEATQLAKDVAAALPKRLPDVRVAVCPSYAALSPVKDALGGSPVVLGAQDLCHEEKGAYTGEVSGRELADLGVKLVIIGHSERRSHVHEDDALIRAKVQRAFKNKMIPVLCVGETRDERDKGLRDVVVERQVRAALEGLDLPARGELVVAYEPVWVIGSGTAVDPEDAARSHYIIRETLRDSFSPETADRRCRVIYGGSVDKNNVGAFLARPVIDGVLVGGASLSAPEFTAIVEAARAADAKGAGRG